MITLKKCVQKCYKENEVWILDLHYSEEMSQNLIALGFTGLETYIRIMQKDDMKIVSCLSSTPEAIQTFYLDKNEYPLEDLKGRPNVAKNHCRHMQIDAITEYIKECINPLEEQEKAKKELEQFFTCPKCGKVIERIYKVTKKDVAEEFTLNPGENRLYWDDSRYLDTDEFLRWECECEAVLTPEVVEYIENKCEEIY